MLSVKHPNTAKAGYYYCVAENKYGKQNSLEARLDVLKSTLATQKISLSVDSKNWSNSSAKFPVLMKRMTLLEGLTVMIQHNLQGTKSKIYVDIFSDPKVFMKKVNKESMMDAAAISRQILAKSMAIFVSQVMKKFIEIDNHTNIEVDKNSLMYEYKLNICQPGYRMDADGFTCGK